MILSIDPASRKMAWVVFDTETEGIVHGPQVDTRPEDFNNVELFGAWRGWARGWEGSAATTRVIIEMPDHMAGEKSNDRLRGLVQLGGCVGAMVTGFLEILPAQMIRVVEPREWKGKESKEVTRQKMKWVFGKRLVETWTHDETDAVAIALWYAKKIKADETIHRGRWIG